MTEFNSERALAGILREICAEWGIRLTSFSGDWIFCLQTEQRTAYVFGYDFGLNSATARMIAKDKAATAELLDFHKIPTIEHRVFHGPKLAAYVPMKGNWSAMLDYFESCGRDVVCKPNEGTGGNGVIRARNAMELEMAVHRLFETSRSICLSPFGRFEDEYRVAVINGRAELLYKKQRPAVAGDGKRTVLKLILDQLADADDPTPALPVLAELAESRLDLARVPTADEEVVFNWRHNLGQGATPELLDPTAPQTARVVDLALRATKALGINLASVDIVETGDEFKVLEINAGIMMENLVRLLPQGREVARRFYEKVICATLDLKPESKKRK